MLDKGSKLAQRYRVYCFIIMCRSCDVSKILIDLVSSAAVLAHKKGQALELEQNPDDAPYCVAIDEFSLRQVFSNLLDSSLQHILPGGWVKVELMGAPGGGVLVIIDDNGPDLALMASNKNLLSYSVQPALY